MANSGTGRPTDDDGDQERQPKQGSSAEERARERLERQRNAGGRGGAGRAGGRPGGGGRQPQGRQPQGRQGQQAGRQGQQGARQGQQVGRAGRPQPRPQGRPNRPPQRGRRRSRGGMTSTTRNAALFGSIFVVLAVVIIVLVSTLGGSGGVSSSAGKGFTSKPAPASITSGLAGVTNAELSQAGAGGGQVIFNSTSGPVYSLHGQPPLTQNGKPLVAFFGAEYCPFCAATRWALVVALDKFGTFSGLQITKSSPVDFAPNTPTLDFSKATYQSQYLSFVEDEQLSNSCTKAVSNPSPPPKYACASLADYPILQKPTKFMERLVTKYDSSTFVGPNAAGGIPFVDIGNRWVESGAPYPSSQTQFPPVSLDGLTWQQIVGSLQAPQAGSTGQAILGAANDYIAAFCELLGGKGPAICHASFITALEKTIK